MFGILLRNTVKHQHEEDSQLPILQHPAAADACMAWNPPINRLPRNSAKHRISGSLPLSALEIERPLFRHSAYWPEDRVPPTPSFADPSLSLVQRLALFRLFLPQPFHLGPDRPGACTHAASAAPCSNGPSLLRGRVPARVPV